MVDSRVIVLPGDMVPGVTKETKLGPGIATERYKDVPFISKPGLLRNKGSEKVWVHCQQKRYVPVEGEKVVGVVTRTGRVHRVDIGSSQLAVLPELAFEGSTKRNKQSVGDCVFGKLVQAHPHCEPELTCVDSNGRSNGMRLLKLEGCISKCSLSLCRQLLTKSCPILKALEKHYKFECVVGLNGIVWISATSLVHTIAIRNCLLASEFMNEESINKMVDQSVSLL